MAKDRRGQQVPAGGTAQGGRSAIEADAQHAQWDAERQAIRRTGTARATRALRREAEEAERNYDLNQAAELRYGQITELERKLQAAEEQLVQTGRKARLLARSSPRTRSPKSWPHGRAYRSRDCRRANGKSCCGSTRILHERVIGQDEAVQLVADAVIRARSGIGIRVARSARSSSSAHRGR